jgi:hypothetical protein
MEGALKLKNLLRTGLTEKGYWFDLFPEWVPM